MFDSDGGVVSTGQLAGLVDALPRLDGGVDDAERIDQIRLLERIKSAAAAVQAKVTADLAGSQRQAQTAAGLPARDLGRGIAAQVGLAKRESPARARRYVGWAGVLVGELPHTLAALQRGDITEWRAMIVARETGWLSVEHRTAVDTELAGRLEAMGDRQTEAETKKIAYRLDPHGYLARSRGAETDRRVTLRPAPDTMARLTGLLPVAQGVAAYAGLQRHADTLIGGGDPRTRAQIMADTLIERVTGQPTADAVPAEIQLLITDRALLNLREHDDRGDGGDDGGGARTGAGAGADEPAHLHGHGPIPAELARRLVADAPDGTARWLRRLYTDPHTGALVAMESRRRPFDHALRRFLVIRDQTCRTPWCDAPIRHADHPIPVEDGGPTSAANGQGLCQACNHAKQAPGWRARPGPGGAGHQVLTTTPTGHRYHSRPPDPPGTTPPNRLAALTTPEPHSRIEHFLRELLLETHDPAA